MTTDAADRLGPESIVAKIIEELNQNPEARILLLRTLLSEDLLSLPSRVERIEQKVDEIQQDVSELKQDMTTVKQNVSTIQQDVSMIMNDMAPLKGLHARTATGYALRVIARVNNCRYVRELNSDELYDLVSESGDPDISPGDMDSFEAADFVIEANHRETGETYYIAIETSYTGQMEDARRAMRNAGYLTRFTGRPARAVVAALQITPDVEAAVGNGQVVWYKIQQRLLQPE